MKLVIIESPGKREALKKYLGSGYEVMSSKGHVRDLPQKSLGVDLSHNFQPTYEVMPDKKTIISDLKKKAKEAETVLLASDPDREGEAIAWHIAYCLGIPEDTTCRVVFNEISKTAVEEAMKKPRTIDLSLVDAQQARRVLDRIVGYKVSPIICKKIAPKLSAGRVQSVALKIIVDREKEIKEFVPEEYWNVWANVNKQKDSMVFKTNLVSYKTKKVKFTNKQQTDDALNEIKAQSFVVENIKKTKTKSHAPAPFTTSTMQQDALNKLGMSIKLTSKSAQELYEGVELAGEGKVALVTYIRSDSTRVSEGAQKMARDYIMQKFGKEFVPEKNNIYKTKGNAQDAHEAIRPISIERTPESVKGSLSAQNYKLYKLIYERFLASQMAEAIYNSVVVDIKAGDYGFKSTGKTLEFAGFTAVYHEYDDKEKEDNIKIPQLDEGDVLLVKDINSEQKFTKPPARYTEASLVKAMEEKGIGRPATYAQTILTLYARKYIDKDGKALIPTELGTVVTDYLDKHFKSVINVKFTAYMESRLDEIAEHNVDWKEVVSSFWKGFQPLLKSADLSFDKVKREPQKTDIVCDKCGSPMVVREGRFGTFLGCSNYPACKNIIANNKVVGKCPKCGKNMLERKSKKGTLYYACEDMQACKFMSWDIPVEKRCPECGQYMVKKGKSIKCSACNYAEKGE